jgi:predicted RNA-binding Zn ribbon-like protein
VAQQVVDGLALPVAVSGHPALELCNSVAGWAAPQRKDYLRSYDHLAVLARESGLLGAGAARQAMRLAGDDPAAGRAALGEAGELREALYAVLTRLPPVDPAGASRLATRIADATRYLALDPTAAPAASWAPDPAAGVRLPVVAFALATFRLFDSGLGAQVSVCPGRGCGWLFLNESGRRRWCIMAICGNRAKARRYADRRRQPRSRPDPTRPD